MSWFIIRVAISFHFFFVLTKVFTKIRIMRLFCKAIKGECVSSDEQCYHNFYIFTAIIFFLTFFMSSGRVGSLLLQLRSVEPEDKVS